MAVGYATVKVGQTANRWDPLEVWRPGGISTSEIAAHNNQIDQAATAANAARAYQTTADNAAESILASAREGLDYIKGQGGGSQELIQSAKESAKKIDSAITNVNDQSGLLNTQAGLLNKQATLVNNEADNLGVTANKVQAEVDALKPYTDQLNAYAGQLWNEGTSMFGSGTELVDLGSGLMNLDENKGGIIGQYVSNLKKYDPSSKVAMAAADVQKSFDNAKGQLGRELSRSGLTLSSGAALAQKRLLSQTYAATLAGAKTRTYNGAISEQTSALRTALADSLSMIKQGTDTQAQGATVQNMGVSAGKSAADVQSNVVAGHAKVADVQSAAATARTNAASVQKSAADAMASAGTLYGKAGDLAAEQASAYSSSASANNSYLSALTSAYGNLTNAYSTYTDYMSSQAQGFAEYATSMGGALFG